MTARGPGLDALIAVVVLVALAAGFWIVFWYQSADSALTRAPQLDEAYYLREAARWRAEGGPGDQPFIMSPGYPPLVAVGGGQALTGGVLASHPVGLLAIQAVAWLACGLIAGAVVRGAGLRAGLSHRRALAAGLFAALLALLYRPAAIYARTILLDGPLTALVAGALAAALATRPRVVVRALVAGVCLGLAASLRAHVLVLLVLLVPLLATGAGTRGRRALAAGLLLALALLPATVASLHNSRVTGRPAGPSLNAGINLYLGQQPGTGGLFTSLAGFDFAHDPAGEAFLAERLGRPVAGPGEADRIWQAEARARIARAPGRALAGWLHKIWLHLQAWEIAQVTPLSTWPTEAPVLRLLPVPWWLLVIASLVGTAAAVGGGRWSLAAGGSPLARSVAAWALAAALLIAVQSLFFVVSRYRLILVPPLAVLAGLGLVAALAPAGSRCRRHWLAPAIALPVAVLLVIPWGLDEVRRTWSGLEDFNLARRLMVVDGPGDRDRADRLLAGTCAVAGERSQPWQLRVENLLQLGRPDDALVVLADGILQTDDPAALERARIAVLRQSDRLDEAEALSRSYLRDHPEDLDVLHDLAVLQGRRGHWTAAAATAQRLRRTAPTDHRGWLDQAVALARLDRSDEAIGLLREGLARVPEGPGRDLLAENLRRLERRASGP